MRDFPTFVPATIDRSWENADGWTHYEGTLVLEPGQLYAMAVICSVDLDFVGAKHAEATMGYVVAARRPYGQDPSTRVTVQWKTDVYLKEQRNVKAEAKHTQSKHSLFKRLLGKE